MAVAAPAAQAVPPTDVIPFDVSRTIGPNDHTVPTGQEFDTGYVGVCDPDVGCTGFRVTEATSDVGAGFNEGRVTLRGVICIRSIDPRCSPDGETPFSGIKISDRRVDTPEPYVDPISVYVNVCVWWNSDPDAPMGCDIPVLVTDGADVEDSGNLIAFTPQELGLSF